MDDLLVGAHNLLLIDNLAVNLAQFFELKALGPVFQFLGIEVYRNKAKRTITITQSAYTTKLLSKFYDREKLSPRQTPWPPRTPVPIPDEKESDNQRYQQQIRNLNYLTVNTRPNIIYTINKLAKGNHRPSDAFQRILKHVWQYLQGTKDFGIVIGTLPGKPPSLVVYADTAFADDLRTRYSTAGHIAMLGSSLIYWTSRLQNLVTTSTTKAEFINLTPAGKTLLWLSSLLSQMGRDPPLPLILFTDSRNARHTVLNPLNSARTRYIDFRYKWVTDMVRKGYFKINHVSTEEMVADGLTKGLGKEKHNSFVKMLGIKGKSSD